MTNSMPASGTSGGPRPDWVARRSRPQADRGLQGDATSPLPAERGFPPNGAVRLVIDGTGVPSPSGRSRYRASAREAIMAAGAWAASVPARRLHTLAARRRLGPGAVPGRVAAGITWPTACRRRSGGGVGDAGGGRHCSPVSRRRGSPVHGAACGGRRGSTLARACPWALTHRTSSWPTSSHRGGHGRGRLGGAGHGPRAWSLAFLLYAGRQGPAPGDVVLRLPPSRTRRMRSSAGWRASSWPPAGAHRWSVCRADHAVQAMAACRAENAAEASPPAASRRPPR